MQIIDGTPVFSATDLVGFVECDSLPELERAALAGLVQRPSREDPDLEVLQRRGQEHETRYLAYLRDLGLEVADGRDARAAVLSPADALRRDCELTLQRMREGVDVIYQATLFDGCWRGYADFLLRVTGPSALGDYHYEVADTKLARRTKASALLQMCVYSDLLAQLQGRMPERIHVALGGSGHHVDSHRLDDYFAYYRQVKERFTAAFLAEIPPTYPLPRTPVPVHHCGVCRWEADCAARRRADDHLSLVAGMRTDQARKLAASGIGTVATLAALTPPFPQVEGMSDTAFVALQAQARLQVASRERDVPEFELLPVEPNRGLAILPPPSAGDLFFDMEGDPFTEEDGLEYLFGVIDPQQREPDGAPTFRTWWAHSRADEKVAFERFIDFVTARWRRDPSMHVYHYAAYEPGRMGMLSTRHATREREVDQLLRAGVLVDLYRSVRQGLRIGVESYSIKKLEPLYALRRSAPLKDAGSSVVAYENYIASVGRGAADESILAEIAEYNRDDCLSNLALRDWLEAQRDAARDEGLEILRPTAAAVDADRPLSEADRQMADLVEQLTHAIPQDPVVRAADPDAAATWLLAMLLEWHRREENAEWWEFFRLCGLTDADLVREDLAIGELTHVGEVDAARRVHRYHFDPAQEYRIGMGQRPVDPRTQRSVGLVVAIDSVDGTIDLVRPRNADAPHPTSLIPEKPVPAKAQKAALRELGEWVAMHGIAGSGPYQAGLDLLRRVAPRVGQSPGSVLTQGDEAPLAAAVRLGRQLRHSYLPVQGPPGSGKTYAGAEMILALLRQGRKVGITAFTHKAIINLLDEVLEHAGRAGFEVHAIRKPDRDEDTGGLAYACGDTAEVAEALASGTAQLAAGTAFMWARPELTGAVDTVCIDEAGQLSLANVLSITGATQNLVLLGDPQQLSQVRKGSHPDGAGVSALEHALGNQPVIAADMGLLLAATWRLHPDVCRFTSDAFYEGQLHSAPGARGQSLHAPGELTGTGVRWIPVVHSGNRNSSAEEASRVKDLHSDLLKGRWTGRDGVERPLTANDILVVAPYNAQVELLATVLPPGSRIGTVDKFQGQEAAAVIYSMASSSADEVPRGLEFLLSLNRLNVATSRACCLAAIVASPDLLRVRCRTPVQMRLANALCRFVELAVGQAGECRLAEVASA